MRQLHVRIRLKVIFSKITNTQQDVSLAMVQINVNLNLAICSLHLLPRRRKGKEQDHVTTVTSSSPTYAELKLVVCLLRHAG